MTIDTDWGDLIDAQIEQQGLSAVRVTDGMVFTFTKETLEKLLAAATTGTSGRVVLFVKHQVLQ